MHPRTAAAVSWWIDSLPTSASQDAVTRFSKALAQAIDSNATQRGAYWGPGHAPIMLHCSRIPLGLLLAQELMRHYDLGTPLDEIDRLWPDMKQEAERRLDPVWPAREKSQRG